MGDAARRPLTVALAFTLAAAILVLEPAPSVSAASDYTVTDFSVLGLDGVELKDQSTVISGYVGANNAGGTVKIKSKAVVDPSSLVVGDTVSLGKNSVVTDVAANEVTGKGVPAGQVISPVALPLVDDLPDTPTFTPGTEKVDVKKGEAVILEPGAYGKLKTKKEATVTFTGGEYHFASWNIGKDTALYFQGPSQIYVDGRIKLGSGMTMSGEPAGAELPAYDLVLWSSAAKGGSAVDLGKGSTIRAHLYAPNGKVRLRRDALFTGQVVGRKVTIDKGAAVTLETDPNDPPIAVDDEASMLTTDIAVVVPVLDNDSDPDGDLLSVAAVTDPTSGSVVINVDNTVTYTPTVGFVGVDSFTYDAGDGYLTDTATVTITVTAPPLTVDPENRSVELVAGSRMAFDVTIEQAGGGPVDFTVTPQVPWLSAPDGNSAAPLRVTVDASGLAVGLYAGAIELTATGGSSAVVTVDLEVVPFNGSSEIDFDPLLVSTVAGNGDSGAVDGVGTAASFGSPGNLAGAGKVVYIVDGNTIRAYDEITGAVSTLVGDPNLAGCDDTAEGQPGLLDRPTDIASNGAVVVVMESGSCGNTRVRVVDTSTGDIRTIGSLPTGAKPVVLGSDGYFYALRNLTIYRIDPTTDEVVPWVNTKTWGLPKYRPENLAADADGGLWFTGTRINRYLFRVNLADKAPTQGAQVREGWGFLEATAGDFISAPPGSTRIYERSTDGSATSIAGVRDSGYQDGIGADGWLSGVVGMVVLGDKVYFSDSDAGRLRVLEDGPETRQGLDPHADTTLRFDGAVVTTVAGNGTAATIDGVGQDASFEKLRDVVVVDGFAYVAQFDSIRKVDLTTGVVTTFAGTPGTPGCTRDVDPTRVLFSIDMMTTDGRFLYTTSSACSGVLSSALWRTSLSTGATSLLAANTTAPQDLAVLPDGGIVLAETFGTFGNRIDPDSDAVTRLIPRSHVETAQSITADSGGFWTFGGGGAFKPDRFDYFPIPDYIPITVAGKVGRGRYTSAGDHIWATDGNQIDRITKADGSRINAITNSSAVFVDDVTPGLGFGSIAGSVATDGTALYFVDSTTNRLRVVTDGFLPPGSFAFGYDGYGAWRAGVNAGLGSFVTSATDHAVSTVGPALEVTRTYNSADPRVSAFGKGWTFNYDLTWRQEANGDVVVLYPDGRRERHTDNGDGTYRAPEGYNSTLTGGPATGFTLTHKDGTAYAFDPAGLLTSITDANGRALTLAYTGDELSTVTSASGRTLAFTWAGGHITEVASDAVGGSPLVWKYYYEGDLLSDACDPRNNANGGTCVTYTYTLGRITEIRKPRGNLEARVAYYPSGEVHWREDGSGNRTTFVKAAEDRVEITDGRGNTSVQVFDDLRRLVTEMGPTGDSTTYTYDAEGNRDTITDANGNIAKLGYDDLGNVTSTTNGEGETTWFAFDADNNLVARRDGRSAGAGDNTYRTSFAYDAARNKLTETNPLGDTERWQYTDGAGVAPAGLVERYTDARGNATGYEYEASGDLGRVTSPVGLVTEYAFDELGRLTSETVSDPVAGTTATTTYTYDAAGNQLTATGPPITNPVTGVTHQARTTSVYDANSNATRSTESDLTGGDASRVTTFGYDSNDRQINVTDPTGGVLRREYDAVGNVTAVIDQEGRRVETVYDSRNLANQTVHRNWDDGSGATRDITLSTTTYDATGRKTSETDAEGRVTRWAYDRADRVLTVTREGFMDVDGTTRDVLLSSTGYDNAGNPTTITTGDGTANRSRITNGYDTVGRLSTSTLDPSGLDRVTTYTYDPAGNVTRVSTSDGSRTEERRNGYDPANRLSSMTVENGATDLVTGFGYDARGNRTRITDPKGNATTTGYDEANRPTVITSPQVTVEEYGVAASQASPQTTTGYDTWGNATDRLDERGFGTTTAYDKLDRQIRIEHPAYLSLSTSETFGYDAVGNLLRRTSRRGHTTDFVFDDFNRVVAQTDPLLTGQAGRGVTKIGYDDVGNRTAVVDPNGARTEWSYDALDRPRTMTQIVRQTGESNVWTYGYDDLGNQTLAREPSGAETVSVFNAASELISVLDQAGESIAYRYDLAGRLTRSTDQIGRINESTYDLAGRLTAQIAKAPDGTVLATTGFDYDSNGNRTSVTTPRGNATSYGYDVLNRLTAVAVPVSSGVTIATSYGYDVAGNLTRSTDGRGNETWQTYQAWNLTEDVIEPSTAQHPALADRTWTTTYDAGGLPISDSQPGGVTVSRSFDQLGRLVSESASGGGFAAASRTLGYDRVGNMTSADHPSGALTYGYDDRNLLSSAAGPAGAASFVYDGNGRVTSRTDAAGTASFTWTARSELDTYTDPVTGVTIDYEWTAASQVDRVVYGSAATRDYFYDDQGRLILDEWRDASGIGVSGYAYGYDADGNVTSKTVNLAGNAQAGGHGYGYDDAGRLTSWTRPDTTVVAYGWDDASNRTSAGSDVYSYDERNRLTTGPAGVYAYSSRGDVLSVVGAEPVTFGWDGLGRMASADAVSYTYDSLSRVAERNGTGFTYTGLWIDPTTDGVNTYGRSPSGRVVAHDDGTVVSLVGLDRHGDVTWLADPTTGALSDSKVYDPFGEVAAVTGVSRITVGFQGDYTDPATKEVWMGARWYDPTGAQFRSRDTIFGELMTPVSLNRYTYGFANPLVFWDPDGRFGNRISIEGTRNVDQEKAQARRDIKGRAGRASRAKFLEGEVPYDFASYRPTQTSDAEKAAAVEAYMRAVDRDSGCGALLGGVLCPISAQEEYILAVSRPPPRTAPLWTARSFWSQLCNFTLCGVADDALTLAEGSANAITGIGGGIMSLSGPALAGRPSPQAPRIDLPETRLDPGPGGELSTAAAFGTAIIVSWLAGRIATARVPAGGGVVDDVATLRTDTGSNLPRLSTTPAQIEVKFKHAADFGVVESRGAAGFESFGKAVDAFVDDAATIRIQGSYRGDPAILNYNPATRQVVVQAPDGSFVSGWQMSPAQLRNMISKGSLGGG